jgi:hypothetical protein
MTLPSFGLSNLVSGRKTPPAVWVFGKMRCTRMRSARGISLRRDW